MKNLINSLHQDTKIFIKGKEYIVKTKTWYSIEEDTNCMYVKCELSNHKVLVIIPDDELIYIGEVIANMNYKKVSDEELIYNNDTFHKTGEGHQFIKNIEFGNENEVEGKCVFEDYEAENNLISLGILPDKNIRANVYAEIINIKDIKKETNYE